METAQHEVTLEVFWRPGCPYCRRLRNDLRRRRIEARWRNIWTDSIAREFVRQVNHGAETVPTVRLDGRVMTNPSGAEVAAALPGHVATASPAGRPTNVLVRASSWVPTVGFIIAGEAVSAAGNTAVGYTLDGLALLSWWFTRPLRRG